MTSKLKLSLVVALMVIAAAAHAETLAIQQGMSLILAGKQKSVVFDGDDALRQAMASAGGPQSRLKVELALVGDLVQDGCKRITMNITALDAPLRNPKTGAMVPFSTSMTSNVCQDFRPPNTVAGAQLK